jgi:hypothetical protein
MPTTRRNIDPLDTKPQRTAPALLAQDGDDDVAALLRYLGRRPDWTA